MFENLAARLQAIDPAILTDVVRQDQRSSSFEITEWSVKRLSDKGLVNPDGLWLFSGQGHAGGDLRQWSVVLKAFKRPEQETAPDARWYWKRELLVAQSGFLERLRGPVRAPRFYRTDEHEDGLWLWMEHVLDDRSGAWTLDDYALAARQLGRWNGAEMAMAFPTEAWLERRPHRAWQNVVNLENVWQSPLHDKHISAETRQRFSQLWEERELFYGILERLPQCLGHFDCQRRNLFLHRGADESAQLVLIDWAMCGVGALGAELHGLVGGSTTFGDWPAAALAELDAAAFRSYMQGLRESGWSGDADCVRLAFTACLAIYRGAIMPGLMAGVSTPEMRPAALQAFGMAEEDLYLHLLPILNYWLDCADEARGLMKATGMV
jgi:hypothetical protein